MLTAYLVATSRLLETPLCLFIKGPSSAGKNFVTDAVLGFLPSSEVQQLTSSSSKSWNYLDAKLAHKVVYVKERNDAAGSVHPTRLLISEKELVHIVTVKKGGRFITVRRVTKGPIASISTTTQDRVQVDDETRYLSIWLDESPEQTTRIMEAAVEMRNGLATGEKKVWHEVQRLIQKRSACPIELPAWFKNLVPYVRNDNLWARRYFPAFLQACQTVALIRSFGRKGETTGKPKSITVRFTDFAVTAFVFNAVFDHSLDKANDEDLEIQQHVRCICREKNNGASAADLAARLEISTDRAYSLLRKAVRSGAVVRANQPTKTNVKLYLPAKLRPFLPDPGEVFQKVDGLPDRVKFVHPLTGEWVIYSRKRSEQQG